MPTFPRPRRGADAVPTLTVVAVVLLALTVLWGFVDARLIEGVPVWMKPLKFALSFVGALRHHRAGRAAPVGAGCATAGPCGSPAG
jgi:hypothetical protein